MQMLDHLTLMNRTIGELTGSMEAIEKGQGRVMENIDEMRRDLGALTRTHAEITVRLEAIERRGSITEFMTHWKGVATAFGGGGVVAGVISAFRDWLPHVAR